MITKKTLKVSPSRSSSFSSTPSRMNWASSDTVNYYYDGDQVFYDTDENNQVLKEYTYDVFGNPLTMNDEW